MKPLKRRKKVINFLVKLFDEANSMVLSSPIVFKQGTTRCDLLLDQLEVPPPEVLEGREGEESESEEEEVEEGDDDADDDEDESDIKAGEDISNEGAFLSGTQ